MEVQLQKIRVTERALLRRINHRLSKDGTVTETRVQKTRHYDRQSDFGKYYSIFVYTNTLAEYDVDLVGLAKKLGMLQVGEEVALQTA